MQIYINGDPETCADAITVSELLVQLEMGDKRLAIELNGEIVPRSAHVKQKLSESDRVEIVHAIGGG